MDVQWPSKEGLEDKKNGFTNLIQFFNMDIKKRKMSAKFGCAVPKSFYHT